MKKKIVKLKKPVRSRDLPATCGMLYEMEERLVHRMDSKFADVKSEIHGVKSEVQGLKSEIEAVKFDVQELKSDVHELKVDVQGIRSEMYGLKSGMHEIKSEIHRMALLMEEQRAENRYVMDGYAQIYDMIKSKEA